MRETWTFHSAGQLLFGHNATQQLGDVARRLGAKHALIVTDRHLVKAGLADRVQKPMKEAGIDVELFDGGEPEPSLSAAEACIEAAKRGKADIVIGLGGGSNMDLAKVTATVLAHGGKTSDYFGEDKIPGPIAPLVCVPTT